MHGGDFILEVGGGDWASHMMEHELGEMFDVAHGAGFATIWGIRAMEEYDGEMILCKIRPKAYGSRKNGEIRSQQYTFKTEKPGADPKTDRDRTMQFQDRVIAENGTCQDDRHLYRE